jgi:Dolichyl-phosphate-mannose-protein mannosyltransferase
VARWESLAWPSAEACVQVREIQQPASDRSYWPACAIGTVLLISAAAIWWSLAHPFGIHWDEAAYINQIQIDTHCLLQGMLYKLGGRLLKSWGRPPAYRLLALPFLALFGFHTALARLVTLACFVSSAWFVYRATRCIAGRVAGAVAVLVFSLSPEVVSSSIFFSTEGPLFLATSAMLYYVFACWTGSSERPGTWIGLGMAMGLGLLSKASFVIVAAPVFAFWLLGIVRKRVAVQSVASLRNACILALLIAGPWWIFNLPAAFAMAHMARDYVRDSLGSPSLGTWLRWFNTVLQSLLGIAVSVLIGLVLIAAIRKAIEKKEEIFAPLQKVALGACAFAGLPIVLAQLSGTNHLLRHITPAVIPLAIAVGVCADVSAWGRTATSCVVSGALFCAQLLMLVGPVVFPNNRPVEVGFVNGDQPWRVMARFDQWDWTSVQKIGESCGLNAPKVSYLGAGRTFNQPQIEYPWSAQKTSLGRTGIDLPEVTHLWRYEDGPLNWQVIMDSVAKSDLVLTAPRFIGELENRENIDNQYNAEFAARMLRDPEFRGPIRLEMGRFEPVEVLVFTKSSLACRLGPAAPAI